MVLIQLEATVLGLGGGLMGVVIGWGALHLPGGVAANRRHCVDALCFPAGGGSSGHFDTSRTDCRSDSCVAWRPALSGGGAAT